MKKIFHFLSSLKFAFLIIFLIIILSVIGSFIPHGDGSAVIKSLSSIFGSEASSVHNFLMKTGFMDVYSSVPFFILISLFALNLFLCSLKLIPFIKSGFSNYPRSFNESASISLNEEEFLKKISSDGWKTSKEGEIYRIEKHSSGRYGVITLHAAVLVILLGAFIGKIAGFNGFIQILEGTSDHEIAVLPDDRIVDLGFDIRLNDFIVDFYPNSKRPKSYTSKVTIIDSGEEVKTADIDVNHPLKYKNIVFYQTNFGVYPNPYAEVRFHIKGSFGRKDFQVPFRKDFELFDDYKAKIVDFAPTLAVDSGGKIFSSSDEMNNPAFLIEIYKSAEPFLRGWILKNKPEINRIESLGIQIIFDELWGIEYTGLSVKKDPGTFIVYIGFILMCIGLLFTYFLNYTAVFFVFRKNGRLLSVDYKIMQQRKYPLVKPSESFKKLLV